MATQRQPQAATMPAPPPWRGVARQGDVPALHFGSVAREPWDYEPAPPFALDEDGYLVRDSMGLSDRHAKRMLAYGTVLNDHFRGRGMVGVELFMPYVQGSPGKVVAPDLFVALLARQREGRPSYKLWDDPVPDFVLEDLSPSTWRRDVVDKRVLYHRLGVGEYWMFDETGRHLPLDPDAPLREMLVGYRKCGNRWERVRRNAAGRLPSEALELELCVRDDHLRFFDPATGEWLRTYRESETRGDAEAAHRKAAERGREMEKQGREAAERRAEAEKQGRQAAEQRAEAAEQRAEEEAAKAAAARARITELEAKLQARRGSN